MQEFAAPDEVAAQLVRRFAGEEEADALHAQVDAHRVDDGVGGQALGVRLLAQLLGAAGGEVDQQRVALDAPARETEPQQQPQQDSGYGYNPYGGMEEFFNRYFGQGAFGNYGA